MKHKLSFIITLWWVLLMGFLGGMILWLAPKEDRISEDENRYLAGMPAFSYETVIDGSFMAGVENYLSDGFFNRGKMIKYSSDIVNIFDIKTEDEIISDDMEQAVNEFMEDANDENHDSETSQISVDETDDNTTNEDSENNEVSQEDVIEEYTFWLDYTDGTQRVIYDYPIENLDISINALNKYRSALPDDGQLHFFQIPYAYLGNLLIEDRYNRYTGWGCNAEDYLAEHAADGVYIHNGPDILEEHLMNRELLYYTTDYHWTALGAHYALSGIRENMNLPNIAYNDYEYTVFDCYVGHGQYDDPETANDTDILEVMHPVFPVLNSLRIEQKTQEYEMPYMYYNHGSYLAYFAGTKGPWRKVETGADTGRICLVITDSFGNAFIPYLFPYYDEVHVLDLRAAYYDRKTSGASAKELIEYFNIDDAYVMLSTSSSMNSPYMLEVLDKHFD